MRSISLETLNELLKNKSKYLLYTERGHQGVGNVYDGVQGEYNETFKFYKHPGLPDNIFMKEIYQSDSYGDDDRLVSIEFVQGKTKTITVYEPV